MKKKGSTKITLERAPDGSFYGTIEGTNEEIAKGIKMLGEALVKATKKHKPKTKVS